MNVILVSQNVDIHGQTGVHYWLPAVECPKIIFGTPVKVKIGIGRWFEILSRLRIASSIKFYSTEWLEENVFSVMTTLNEIRIGIFIVNERETDFLIKKNEKANNQVDFWTHL